MQTLFTSDRMIVKGEIKTYLVDDLIPADIEEGKENAELVEWDTWDLVKIIHLDFVFQVNGKLSQFQYMFVIEEIKTENYWEITLKNWFEWYPLAELFFIMGYNFGDHPMCQSPMVMKKWINICNWTKS
jgi:hypothetical protein